MKKETDIMDFTLVKTIGEVCKSPAPVLTELFPLWWRKLSKQPALRNITRLSGDNPGETALAIAEKLEIQKGRPVILVNENSYADALAVSSIGAVAQSPILPVGQDRLSAEMKTKLAELNPDRVYLIDGEGVLSPAIVKEIGEITSLDSSRIIRIAGANRYETALAIAKYFNPQGQSVCLATGGNFLDTLAGSGVFNIITSNYQEKLSQERNAARVPCNRHQRHFCKRII